MGMNTFPVCTVVVTNAVAVISHAPLHVSDIEAMPASQLATEQLMRRFPRAEVRQFLLEVAAEPQP